MNTSMSEGKLREIRERLPEFLSEKRLNHTFFVEKEAIAIAESVFLVYNDKNGSINELCAAALLHDLTKELPLSEHLKILKDAGISAGAYPSGAVLHGKTAAIRARELFGISDAVFSAVDCHTTGKENMSVLDKIVFLADYIEPSRTAASCAETRNFFYSALRTQPKEMASLVLDRAVLMCLDNTLSYLLKVGTTIDIQTVLAWNYLIGQGVKLEN